MHILLIHQAFAALDEAGGTRHAELAAHLAERGHTVTIIASPVSYLTGKASYARQQTLHPGVTVIRTYTYAARHRSFFLRLIGFFSFMISSFIAGIKVGNVDLVWGTSPPIFQGVTAWLVARLKRKPFLLEIRDLWPEFAIAVGVLKNPLIIRLSLWLERFLYRRADRVMVNSPGFIDHVTHLGARRVDLVPNGADPGMFDPGADGSEFRRLQNLGSKFIVLYAGAHGLSNDLGIVLEAAVLLRENQDIQFLMVGDGKEKNALVEQSRAFNLQNVLFLPPVPKSEMGKILAAADACIAILKPIELFKTTYPNKVFDYMAAAKPVALAIDGVIRQVVEAADAGIFIHPGDAQALAQTITKMAGDRPHCVEMGLNGRTYLEKHFNRVQLAEKLTLLLQEIGQKNG